MTKRLTINRMNSLEQMDKYARVFNFPMLNNIHWRVSKTRLTSFVNLDEWLIVFEVIVFDIKGYTFENMIYAYGNKIDNPGFQTGVDVIREPPDKPFEDEEGNKLINLSNFSVIINDEEHQFLPTEEDYKRAGILRNMEMEPEVKLLRLVCFLLPKEAFFLKDLEILHILKRPNLDKFLQVYEWYHPDIARGELPSQNPCLVSLAEAITYHNNKLYECATDKINTHWANW